MKNSSNLYLNGRREALMAFEGENCWINNRSLVAFFGWKFLWGDFGGGVAL